jgi:hypothetical protein
VSETDRDIENVEAWPVIIEHNDNWMSEPGQMHWNAIMRLKSLSPSTAGLCR